MVKTLQLSEANRFRGKSGWIVEKHAFVPMPGYTHMQRAMLSSVGLWSTSFVQAILDDEGLLSAAYELNDQCPLGSAASYGVPLPIDRKYVADFSLCP